MMESISRDELAHTINCGINDTTGQKYLTGLIWGQAGSGFDRNPPDGISQLLNHQNDLIATFQQHNSDVEMMHHKKQPAGLDSERCATDAPI